MKHNRLLNLLKANAQAAPLRAETQGEAAHVYLYDVIDAWFGVSAQMMVDALKSASGKTVHLHINSPGGDVFESVAMATAIAAHDGDVIAHIDGVAASAATRVALAAKEVRIADSGLMMIHNSWTIAWGNSEEIRKTADLLDKVGSTILAQREELGRLLSREEGKTLPVNADFSKAQEALDRLKAYANESAQFELKVSTEKAQAAVTNVERQIGALAQLQTESRHLVQHNADAARAEVMSLAGMHTTSTHTIYVTKVETNATGGMVGRGLPRFARGGSVAPLFPRMAGGKVPGSGDADTVPRTLDAGAFVIRKAAVHKYGIATRGEVQPAGEAVAHGVVAVGGDVVGGQERERLATAGPAEVEAAGEPRLRQADVGEGVVGPALKLEGHRVAVVEGRRVDDLMVGGADLEEAAAKERERGLRGPVGRALVRQPVGGDAEGEVVEEADRELEAVDVRRAEADRDAEHAVVEVPRRAGDVAGEVAPQPGLGRGVARRGRTLRHLESCEHWRVARVLTQGRRCRAHRGRRRGLARGGERQAHDERSDRQRPPLLP